MSTKRSKRAKNPPVKPLVSPPQERKSTWQKLFLMFTTAPMALGLLLIITTLIDVVVLGSLELQLVLGVLCILAGFVASNALQKQWNLTIGWALLGIAVVLWANWLDIWVRVTAYVLGGLGLFFLGKEFVQRFQQQQNNPKT
jgi:hypothetical protein